MEASSIKKCDFTWAEESIEMKEFFDDYSDILPVIVRLVEGYEGVDVTLSFSSDEVYWIFGIQKQKKIIAKEQMGRYLSIPLENHFKFQSITKNSLNEQIVGQPVSFESFLQEPGGGYAKKFIFEKNQEVSFLKDLDDEKSSQFGAMEYVDMYKESNFLAHSMVNMDTLELHPCVHHMPVYVPIKLRVATGFIDRDQREYDRWMDSVIDEKTDEGFFNKKETYRLPSKILVYDERPETDSPYEYIRPQNVILANNRKTDEVDAERLDAEKLDAEKLDTRKLDAEMMNPNTEDNCQLPDKKIPPPLPPRNKKMISCHDDVGFTNKNRSSPVQYYNDPKPRPSKTCMKVSPIIKQPSRPATPTKSNNDIEKTSQPTTKFNNDNNWNIKKTSRPATPTKSNNDIEKTSKPTTKSNNDNNWNIKKTSRPSTPTKSNNDSWNTLSDIPLGENIQQWSIDEVVRCLGLLKISPSRVNKFRDQEVDGSLLMSLDETVLIADFDLTLFEAKKLMKFVREGWRPNTTVYEKL